jgi:hypothetical protein
MAACRGGLVFRVSIVFDGRLLSGLSLCLHGYHARGINLPGRYIIVAVWIEECYIVLVVTFTGLCFAWLAKTAAWVHGVVNVKESDLRIGLHGVPATDLKLQKFIKTCRQSVKLLVQGLC